MILGKQSGALRKADPDGAVAALVDRVAGGLIAQKIDVDVVVDEVVQKIDDVAVIRDRERLSFLLRFLRPLYTGRKIITDFTDPALFIARFDTGIVDLRDDRGGAGDLRRLALRAAHAA